MILVDINVYALNRTFDFTLDENSPISAVIEEIAEILSRQENNKGMANVEGLMFMTSTGDILPSNYSLDMCNIRTGSSLMLIWYNSYDFKVIIIDCEIQSKVIVNSEKWRSKEEKSSIFQNLITNS